MLEAILGSMKMGNRDMLVSVHLRCYEFTQTAEKDLWRVLFTNSGVTRNVIT